MNKLILLPFLALAACGGDTTSNTSKAAFDPTVTIVVVQAPAEDAGESVDAPDAGAPDAGCNKKHEKKCE